MISVFWMVFIYRATGCLANSQEKNYLIYKPQTIQIKRDIPVTYQKI